MEIAAKAAQCLVAHQTPTPAVDVVRPVVIVVDDEAHMRSALQRLLMSAGMTVETFASGADLFSQARLDRPGCVLLDVGMPDMNGLEVQAGLKERRVELPVIFLTGSSDIPIAVAAMREGAVDFVEKPFDNQDLLARVQRAISRHHQRRKDDLGNSEVLRRLETLTPRERGVLDLVIVGKTSKEIARSLDISPRTVEIHRRNLMEKMAANTLADLVRMRLMARH
jgi:two-component system, LuxR family, response regulator FixJ